MAKTKKGQPPAAPVEPAFDKTVFAAADAALVEATARLKAARLQFGGAFKAYKAAAPSIGAARFWAVVGEYRELLAQQLRTGDRRPARAAARELARRAWVGGGGFKPDSLAVYAAFAREYAARSTYLGGCFDWMGDDLDLERSDDGYSDLIDALPLAGKAVCKRIDDKKFTTNADFEKAVRVAVGDPAVARLILEGESYHDRHLDEALRHYLELSFRDRLPGADAGADSP